MEPSTVFLFNTTADVLRQKDCRLAEQDSLLKHQQKLLAEQHGENACLKKKIEELQCHAATVQGRLFDVLGERAALKCKPVEHVETQTESVESQEMQIQTEDRVVQEMQVQTDMSAVSNEAGIDQYPLVFWKPKQDSTLVSFAQTGVRRFWHEVAAACTVVAAELAEIGMENALLEADEEFDAIKERIRQAKLDLETMPTQEVKKALETMPTPEVKKAAKKKRAAKPTAEEKAAKAEAELKAHQEAVRARQEQERRQKAQAIAEKKAKMQALRASAEEQVRKEAEKQARLEAAGMAKTGRPETFVLSPAQIDRVGSFARITKETFLTRGGHVFDSMGEGLPALLGLYVLECFGSESWQLKQADDKFLLVVDRVFGAKRTPVYYQSPSVSAHDIVFWAEKVDFVKGSEFLFKHTPMPADERVAATIINAFELIRENWAFETLKLRKADLKDDYGLAMQQITLVDKSVMTMTVLKLIIWFRQGRIRAMAMCVDTAKGMAMLDLDLFSDEDYSA